MGFFRKLAAPIAIFIIIIVLGAFVYSQLEGWRYIDSLYFTVVTATTIGYGDIVPRTDAGKIFTMFFAFFGIGMAFYFVSLIGKYFFKKQLRAKLEKAGRINRRRGVHKIRHR